MRAAAILGLGSREKDLSPFREIAPADWRIGLPSLTTDADAILIFGGDGTIHRHLAQLVRLQLPVLIAPQGSGNDFARALRLRAQNDSFNAWRDFCAGKNNLRTIDLGIISPLSKTQQQHYFCCVGGLGLDAAATRLANRMPRWLRGHGGYALSLFGALLAFTAHKIKISQPAAAQPERYEVSFDERTYLAAFANAPTYGGGMKIAPHATMDDGRLDVCLIHDINKLKLFCLFPTVYLGKHLNVPQVKYFQTGRLRIETETPQDVYADGEYVCQTPIDVSVARSVLRVIVPGS